jgi:prephenate dehydratase
MKKIKVAYQGQPGAFSDIALKAYFKNQAIGWPKHTFKKLFESVRVGESNFGMVPIENSIAGSVTPNYDLLASHSLKIVGELYLKITHNLLVIPTKTKDKKIREKMLQKVYSHPVALAQCQKFFTSHPQMKPIVAEDTAGSAKDLAKWQKKDVAAIASSEAAKIYGLEILKKGIETNKNNYTRFVIIAKKGNNLQKGKASLVFSTNHQPGALYQTLGVLAKRKINLTKIESRPIIGQPWKYLFFTDLEIDSLPKTKKAIDELKKISPFLKVLGFYPKGKTFKS